MCMPCKYKERLYERVVSYPGVFSPCKYKNTKLIDRGRNIYERGNEKSRQIEIYFTFLEK